MLDRLFSGSADFKKIVANTGWLVSGQMLRAAAGFVVGISVARYLGPEQYGALWLAASFIALFSPLARLGLDQIVVRDIVRDTTRPHIILGTAFVLKATAGTILVPVATITAMLARPNDPRMGWLTLLAALGGLLLQAFDTIDFWFQSEVRSKYVVQARNIAYFLAAVARLTGVAAGAPLAFFAVVGFLELTAYAIGQVIAYRVAGQSLRAWRFERAIAGRLLRESWPLIISGLAVVVSLGLDQAMLGSMLAGETGTRAVGVYSVAGRLAEMWYIIPAAIASSAFPAVVQARGNDVALYKARMQRLFNLMTLISYVAAPAAILLARPVISLYGAGYEDAAPILIILMWAGLWVSLGGVRNLAIQTEGLLVQSMLATILGTVVNVGLNLLLIPSFAGLGAAVATFISQFVTVYLSCFLFRAFMELGRMQTRAILKPVIFKRV